MLNESEARKIAGDWHGGQWSPLYAFCSSGTITPGIDSEISQCLREVQNRPEYYDEHAVENLLKLRAYIAVRLV
jgi:hypothetical protein